MLLGNFGTYTFKATCVRGVSCAIRDSIIESQHPSRDTGDEVQIDSDYVFDASLDDSILPDAQELCKALIDEFPRTQMFIFLP